MRWIALVAGSPIRHLLLALVLASALVAPLAIARPPTPAPGGTIVTWSAFTPSPDSRVIYVSSSQGNDQNSGLSPLQPKRTIAAGKELLRDGFPDWLLLKRGDVFFEPLGAVNISGRNEFEPLVISAYAEGPRPLLLTGIDGGFSGAVSLHDLRYVAVIGLHMRPHKWHGSGADGPVGVRYIAPGTELLIEDCLIEGYVDNIVIQGFSGIRQNTTIRRCVLRDPVKAAGGSTNIFMNQYDGVNLEENALIHSLAAEQRGVKLSHHVYLVEDNTDNNRIVGNIAFNGGRSNFNIRSGGLIQDNLSIRGAMGITVGIFYAANPSSANIVDNVITETRDNDDGQPLGIGVSLARVRDSLVRGNVITRNTSGTNPTAIRLFQGVNNVQFSDNIVWRWMPRFQPAEGFPVIGIQSDVGGPVFFSGNEIQLVGNGLTLALDNPSPPPGVVNFSANDYFSLRPGTNWFQVGINNLSAPQWQQAYGEWNLSTSRFPYDDPDRAVETYAALVGLNPTVDAFLDAVMSQSKQDWRPQFTAGIVNQWIRSGFAVTGTPRCIADLNRDGLVNSADNLLMQSWMQRGDWQADINQNGSIGIDDLMSWNAAASVWPCSTGP